MIRPVAIKVAAESLWKLEPTRAECLHELVHTCRKGHTEAASEIWNHGILGSTRSIKEAVHGVSQLISHVVSEALDLVRCETPVVFFNETILRRC